MKSARSESIQERFCNSRTVLKHRQELSQINYKRGISSSLPVTCWSRDQTGHRLVSDQTGHRLVSDQTGHRLVSDQTGHRLVSDQTGHRLVSDQTGHRLVSDQVGHRLVSDQVLQRPVRRSFVVDMREGFACENVSNFETVVGYNQHQVVYISLFVVSRKCFKLHLCSCL
jgi:hypothetical protein